MKLTIIPMAGVPGSVDPSASVHGDILTFNGVSFDLSEVGEGDLAYPTGDHPFAAGVPITRKSGLLHATVMWIYNTTTAAPDQPTSVIEGADGPVTDPVRRKPGLEPTNDV